MLDMSGMLHNERKDYNIGQVLIVKPNSLVPREEWGLMGKFRGYTEKGLIILGKPRKYSRCVGREVWKGRQQLFFQPHMVGEVIWDGCVKNGSD